MALLTGKANKQNSLSENESLEKTEFEATSTARSSLLSHDLQNGAYLLVALGFVGLGVRLGLAVLPELKLVHSKHSSNQSWVTTLRLALW